MARKKSLVSKSPSELIWNVVDYKQLHRAVWANDPRNSVAGEGRVRPNPRNPPPWIRHWLPRLSHLGWWYNSTLVRWPVAERRHYSVPGDAPQTGVADWWAIPVRSTGTNLQNWPVRRTQALRVFQNASTQMKECCMRGRKFAMKCGISARLRLMLGWRFGLAVTRRSWSM